MHFGEYENWMSTAYSFDKFTRLILWWNLFPPPKVLKNLLGWRRRWCASLTTNTHTYSRNLYIDEVFFSSLLKWRCPFARRQNGFDVCLKWLNSIIKIYGPLQRSIWDKHKIDAYFIIKFYVAFMKMNNSISYSTLSNCNWLWNGCLSGLLSTVHGV